MQSTQSEVHALQVTLTDAIARTPIDRALQMFLLPSLHVDVPRGGVLSTYEQGNSTLARALLDAGIINPADIPPTTTTVDGVITSGLAAWFNARVGNLAVIQFNFHVLDAQSAKNLEMDFDGSDLALTGAYMLALSSDSSYARVMANQAMALELSCPGLFKTAFSAITTASYMSVWIRLPEEVLNEFAVWHWDADWSTIPSDDEAKEILAERFGDDEDESPESYLPSNVLPEFGGNLCLDVGPIKRTLSKRTLRKLAAKRNDKLAADVAAVTILLLDALDAAKAADASFPGLQNLHATSVERGVTLLYAPYDFAFETIDATIENAYNGGESTNYLGIEEMPKDSASLKKYFEKIDLVCTVVRHMDALISLISTELQ